MNGGTKQETDSKVVCEMPCKEEGKRMDKYSSIINLPHHVSKNRERMTLYQRAAQFAPFSALNGHAAAIIETARLTDKRIELSENECELLNRKTALLMEHIPKRPDVSITYFLPDERKEGGCYVTHVGIVKECKQDQQTIVFEDGTHIPIRDVVDLNVLE